MKTWKSSILILGAVALLSLSCMTVSAVTETDPTGDVFHASWANGVLGYTTTSGKSNIDITAISAEVSDGKLTLSLTVAGDIVDSENCVYLVTYNTSDSRYWMAYGGYGVQEALSFGISTTTGNISMSNVSVEENNTIRSTLNLVGENEKVDFWGMAHEYTGNLIEDPYAEYWVDVAGDRPDFETGDDDDDAAGDNGDTGGGIPGFEVIALLVALGIALVILRRKK